MDSILKSYLITSAEINKEAAWWALASKAVKPLLRKAKSFNRGNMKTAKKMGQIGMYGGATHGAVQSFRHSGTAGAKGAERAFNTAFGAVEGGFTGNILGGMAGYGGGGTTQILRKVVKK